MIETKVRMKSQWSLLTIFAGIIVVYNYLCTVCQKGLINVGYDEMIYEAVF